MTSYFGERKQRNEYITLAVFHLLHQANCVPGTKNSKVKEKDGLSTRIRVDDFILFLFVSMISIVNKKSLLLHDAAIVETWWIFELNLQQSGAIFGSYRLNEEHAICHACVMTESLDFWIPICQHVI